MAGEVSFRKTEQECQCWPHKNQRWVHLPISVCEALRAFGAEFSCLFPCRRSSNCVSTSEREREKGNENGCGAVLARCLVLVNSGEGGRRREIEVVVGGGDETAVRRHVFEDIEVKNGRIEIKGRSLEDEEEEIGRVSICIPPKNALLLMRCRSDPMKMAALANRCNWAAPECENEEDNEEEDEIVDFEGKDEIYEGFEEGIEVSNKPNEEQEIQNEAGPNLEMGFCEDKLAIYSEEKEQEIKEEEEEIESNMSSFEALLEESPTCHSSSSSAQSDEEGNDVVSLPDQKEASIQQEETEESTTSEKDPIFISNDNQNHKPEKTHQQEESENPVLPECLLLMMCEPKLSMEVSKETWVRGTDFIRWLPERPRKAAKAAGCDHVNPVKRRPSIVDSKPKPRVPAAPPTKRNEHQPPRSSCSLPAAASMIERKLVSAGAYEPLALTRCKSEPMRTAAAKLMPEPCFWKNGSVKMEPHGRAALGVGAAGVGF
ncbi:hypothetical protein DH2020_033453 [Rehmannia glutinosa]|uniref:Uncharacterized protein n=1 Tax=Rehmannia glutinosa TaxID=99300 RepID=A0ABR0VEI7_REHGL